MRNSTKKNVKHPRRNVDMQSRRQNSIGKKYITPKKSDRVETNSNIRKRFEIYIRSIWKKLSKRTEIESQATIYLWVSNYFNQSKN